MNPKSKIELEKKMNHIADYWIDMYQTNKEKRENCCGCNACETICPKQAITMKYDSEGFLYPLVDEEQCINCGICINVCPIQNKDGAENAQYLETFAGYSNDSKILDKCTSGGFATAVALKFIEQGGLVCGVRYSDDYIKAEYSIAETTDDVMRFASSKYVQSEKKEIYKNVKSLLDENRKVLFIGCPCDVYAIQRYLKKEYDTFYTCELVCMGVTSYKIAEEYKKISESKSRSSLVFINARSKERGWFVPHLEERFANGKRKYSTLFGTYYGYGFQVYNRPSCLRCSFRGTNGIGDVRIGDFWGIKETDEYCNPKGVSCIFVRNKKGQELISILPEKEFSLFKTTYKIATESNMSSYKNKGKEFEGLRDKFADVFLKRGLVSACRQTASVGFWVKHYVPDRWHFVMKKIYHKFVDKR